MRQENTDARQNKNSRRDIQHPTSPEARPYVGYICTARLNSEAGANTIPCVPGERCRGLVATVCRFSSPNDAGLTVPCQVHALAPIRCRRPVDNSVQNCGARTKAQGFHRSRVRLCEIGSIKCARKMQALAKNTAATTKSTSNSSLRSRAGLRRHKKRVGLRMVPWFRGGTAALRSRGRAKRR